MIPKFSRYLFGVLAFSLALVSCSSDDGEDPGVPGGGMRVISVSFLLPERAVPGDDLRPEVKNGALVKVANGVDAPQDCALTVDDGGNLWLSTDLSGDLTAVYPSSAAYVVEDKISSINVSEFQNGNLSDAYVAKAEISAYSESATFTAAAAILEIVPPAGTVDFTITSTDHALARDEGHGASRIRVSGSPESGRFYIAVCEGAFLSEISVDTDFALMSVPKKDVVKDGVTANTVYSFDERYWHPFMKFNDLLWATVNVGASSVTDPGTYFAWGDVQGQKPSGNSFAEPFDWSRTPALTSEDFSQICFNGALAPEYDAARANWGGRWRMPTIQEIDALVKLQRGWDGDMKGYIFSYLDFPFYNEETLFFPASGYGEDTRLNSPDKKSIYWSASLNDLGKVAYAVAFGKKQDFYNIVKRDFKFFLGCPVRPVADFRR